MKKLLKIEDLQDLPKEIEIKLFSDQKEDFFHQLLQMFDWDLSYDWFQNIYKKKLTQKNQYKLKKI